MRSVSIASTVVIGVFLYTFSLIVPYLKNEYIQVVYTDIKKAFDSV